MVWTDNNIVFSNHPTAFENSRRSKAHPSSGQQEYQRNLEFEQHANQLSRDDQLQQPPSIFATNLEVIGSRARAFRS